MIYSNSEISFLVDTMIVETLLSDDEFVKTAQGGGLVSGLINKVKTYVGNNVDPNDKTGSLLNIIAPGAIAMTFSAMGLGWIGTLFGLAMRIFHIDVKGILSGIYDKIKSALGGGKQMSSSEVDQIVTSSVQENTKPATEEEAAQAMENKTTAQLLRDAKFLKLAMVEFDKANMQMTKEALPSLFSLFSSRKSTTTNLLTKVLSWIFKIAISSAGLMVAGDVVNKFLGRPNALDNTVQHGRPVGESAAPAQQAPSIPVVVPKQTKFRVNPSYRDVPQNTGGNMWVESVPNDDSSIENLLIMFAEQVYSGLQGKEAYIRSAPGLQAIKDRIATYNRASQGDNMVYIPKYFTSKKQIVDMFIDDVANNVPDVPEPQKA